MHMAVILPEDISPIKARLSKAMPKLSKVKEHFYEFCYGAINRVAFIVNFVI